MEDTDIQLRTFDDSADNFLSESLTKFPRHRYGKKLLCRLNVILSLCSFIAFLLLIFVILLVIGLKITFDNVQPILVKLESIDTEKINEIINDLPEVEKSLTAIAYYLEKLCSYFCP